MRIGLVDVDDAEEETAAHVVDELHSDMEDPFTRWLHGFDGPYGALMRAIYLQQRARIWGLHTPQGRALMRESNAWLAKWDAAQAR